MCVGMKTRLIFPVATLVAILMPVEVPAAQGQPTVEISYHGIQGGVRVSDPKPDPKAWTFLLVRGWSGWFGDKLDAYWRQAEAFQKRYPKANVVVVRWLVKKPYPGPVPWGLKLIEVLLGKEKVANYYGSTVAAKQIGEAIVQWMVKHDIQPSKTMVCGHSLGGQIAALIGAESKRLFKAPIHTILATDPAGILFEDKAPSDRLDATDAQHVVVVHTTVVLGDERCIGTADIYVIFPSDKDGDLIWRHQQARELVTECLQGSNPKTQAQKILEHALFEALKPASE